MSGNEEGPGEEETLPTAMRSFWFFSQWPETPLVKKKAPREVTLKSELPSFMERIGSLRLQLL